MLHTKIYMIVAALALACVPAARGVDVALAAPGTLAAAVTSPDTESELRVSGPVDASDLFFIARNMPALTVLDLAGVDIVAYRGTPIAGRTGYAAGLIPQNLMPGHGLTSLTLPQAQGVIIGAGAFARNPLTAITIGSNISAVGDGAFLGCDKLRTASIGTTSVGAGAFAACTALEEVTFATSGTALDASAFADDSALGKVSGSANITTIGESAFRRCSALKTFGFGQGLTAVGAGAFLRSGLERADLSTCSALDSIGAWAFAEMPALTEVNLGHAGTVGDGVVFMSPALERFVASDATDRVAAYAYAHDRNLLAEGLLPSGTRIVGAHALHGLSQLTAITVPASVSHIGDGAMASMTGLTDITTEASDVPTLGSEVWRGVDQPAVVLHVPEGTATDYAAADQWCLFDITEQSAPSGITETHTPAAGAIVRGRFDGSVLKVEAVGTEIARLTLHDEAGIMLCALEPYENLVSADTGSLVTRIYIVSAVLSDGRTATLKLARP